MPRISLWTARRRCSLSAAAMTLCALAMAVDAGAQTSRSGAIAQQEAAKAKTVGPHMPDKAEALIDKMEGVLLDSPSGFYPFFGSVWSGGGFTLGGGYRRFRGDNTFFDVKGLYSFKSYKLVEATTASRGLAQDRVSVAAHVGWRDATEVAYYGLGMATAAGDRANYRFKQGWVGADVAARPTPWGRLMAGLGYEDFALESGLGVSPSIEDAFTPVTAPGLGASPAYVHAVLTAGIDTRPAAGYARRGGLYEVRYHNYDDRHDLQSFDLVDVEVVQHVPLLRESWILSLHGQTQMTTGDVPYFMMPSLGSGSTLRAFPSWRFRDRNSLLLQAEWRWTPNPSGVDMAIFVDAGKVTADRSDLDFTHLETDVGIGFRFHSLVSTPLRIELAKGNEGLRLVFAGGAAF